MNRPSLAAVLCLLLATGALAIAPTVQAGSSLEVIKHG
jgi:hypothetical protein